MVDLKSARAEYEQVNDCFEGCKAYDILQPLFSTDHIKLVIGEKGSGKTHLIKLLSQEKPIELFGIDKETLDSRLEKPEDGVIIPFNRTCSKSKPELSVFDDLHYLLDLMALLKINNYPVNEEHYLDNIEKFVERARKLGTIPVFVADDGPASLSTRFEDKKLQERFLKIFDGCISSSDDAAYYSKFFGLTYPSPYRSQGINSINVNNRGLRSLKELIDVKDYPARVWFDELFKTVDWSKVHEALTLAEVIEWNNPYKEYNCADNPELKNKLLWIADTFIQKNKENIDFHSARLQLIELAEKGSLGRDSMPNTPEIMPSLAAMINNIIVRKNRKRITPAQARIYAAFRFKDIPFAYQCKGTNDTNPSYFFNIENDRVADYPSAICWSWSTDNTKHWHEEGSSPKSIPFTPDTLMANLRELKVIIEKYGEISREALKCQKLGNEFRSDDRITGIAYERRELNKIRSKIYKVYQRLMGYSSTQLGSELLYSKDDKDIKSALLMEKLRYE